LRDLPGGSSLSNLLVKHCGHRNPKKLGPLSEAQIWQWAQAHHRRTGEWPRVKSGAVRGYLGETCNGIDKALARGRRGMPGGSSLYQFLQKRLCRARAGRQA
jgi:hypothetical protein